MVYLITSILIHGILFAYTGLTFIPHAQYSVQPSAQMVEVSIETSVTPEVEEVTGTHPQHRVLRRSNNEIHPISGVKVKANPDYFQNSPPEYPELARQMRQEGLVLLSVDVDRQGEALKIDIIKGSGYLLLDQAALMAVKHWKFQPGRMGGIAIESEVTVPIRFRLEK